MLCRLLSIGTECHMIATTKLDVHSGMSTKPNGSKHVKHLDKILLVIFSIEIFSGPKKNAIICKNGLENTFEQTDSKEWCNYLQRRTPDTYHCDWNPDRWWNLNELVTRHRAMDVWISTLDRIWSLCSALVSLKRSPISPVSHFLVHPSSMGMEAIERINKWSKRSAQKRPWSRHLTRSETPTSMIAHRSCCSSSFSSSLVLSTINVTAAFTLWLRVAFRLLLIGGNRGREKPLIQRMSSLSDSLKQRESSSISFSNTHRTSEILN